MKSVFRAYVPGLALVVLLTSPALAQDRGSQGLYASFSGSLILPHEVKGHGDKLKFENGFGINVMGGYRFDTFLAELEVGYRSADAEEMVVDGTRTRLSGSDVSIDFSAWSFMANSYLDLPVDWGGLTAYIGLGLGVALTEIEASRAVQNLQLAGSETDTAFAYQFMAGAAYTLTDAVELFAGYRFVGSRYESSDLRMHEFEAGLLFVF